MTETFSEQLLHEVGKVIGVLESCRDSAQRRDFNGCDKKILLALEKLREVQGLLKKEKVSE